MCSRDRTNMHERQPSACFSVIEAQKRGPSVHVRVVIFTVQVRVLVLGGRNMNCLALPECNIHKHKSKSLKDTVVLGPLVLADPDMRNSALQRGLSCRSDEDPKP